MGDINVPTWGSMLSDGFTNLYTSPLLILWPALAIGLTLICLTLLANSLRDELERSNAPRKQNRKTKGCKTAAALQRPAAEEVIRHPETGRSEGDVVLDVANLSVGYPSTRRRHQKVVNDVSLTVRRGEVHGLVGESGSGKTQTAWSILRLLPEGGKIVGGSIHFQGKDLAKLSEREMEKIRGRSIAYIPQEPMSNLDPSFTIGSQLVEPMQICLGISAKEAKERALSLLARVGIPNPERTFAAYPHEVSGGMAQRVLIAGRHLLQP